uniref:STAS domain-containing protein n=1 Tax=Peronospora matthiolae TaxID=2874970 RepID=A0AAV1TVY6_9STRA
MSWLQKLVGRQPPSSANDRFALPEPTWQQRLEHYAPIFRWLPEYSLERDFKFDLVAGITVAMMLIPQEVSLATIMHVPAHYGLHTAAISPIVYAIFGSSTVLSVASGSEVSLLVGSVLESVEDPDERIATVIFMSFLCGSILLLIRIFNLSQIADFFSRPVMGGFISAGGLLIMLSQVCNALGIDVKSSEYPPIKVYELLRNVQHTNLNAFAVAAISCIYLIALKMVKRRCFPSPVAMQLFNTDTSHVKEPGKGEEEERFLAPVTNSGQGFSLSDLSYTANQTLPTPIEERESMADGGKREGIVEQPQSRIRELARFLLRMLCDLGPFVVCIFGGIFGYVLGPSRIILTGPISGGFPGFKVPWYGFNTDLIDRDRLGTIFYNSVTVSIVVFLSSISMSKRLAIQRGEDVITEQELTGIGISSVICGFFQGVPPTGGMSRTAVNMQNARTQVASVITCLLVILALYTLTDMLYYLPSATLASIIIVAGWTLVEFREAKWLYRVKRDDFYVWASSFSMTLGLGVLNGLVASIVCSILALMWKSKVQPIAILGELDNGSYVDRQVFPDAKHLGDIIAIRVEGSLYFANCERVTQYIEREMMRLHTLGVTTRGVVLDMFHMNDMDATTIQVLSDVQEKLAVRKVRFALANAKSRLRDLLAATNVLKRILANDPSISLEEAVLMLRELPSLAAKSTSVRPVVLMSSNPV